MWKFKNSPGYVILMLSFLLASCSDDPEPIQPLQSYDISYMFYAESIVPHPDKLVTIEFSPSGKVVKRVGGLLGLNPASGYLYQFTEDIYDEATVDGNCTILTEKENIDDFELSDPNERKIFFDGDKIDFIARRSAQPGDYIRYDSTFFVYEGNRIDKTVRRNWVEDVTGVYFNYEEVKYFTYYRENVVKIQGSRRSYTGTVTMTTLETFDQFDQAPNPTKALILFDEVFYRSLSKNNFSEYRFQRWNRFDVLVDSYTLAWDLHYVNGVPTFK